MSNMLKTKGRNQVVPAFCFLSGFNKFITKFMLRLT